MSCDDFGFFCDNWCYKEILKVGSFMELPWKFFFAFEIVCGYGERTFFFKSTICAPCKK